MRHKTKPKQTLYCGAQNLIPCKETQKIPQKPRENPILGITIFTNPSDRVGYDTMSILKRSLTGLKSEFSFS